jgi:hypothetical protein
MKPEIEKKRKRYARFSSSLSSCRGPTTPCHDDEVQ